MKTANPTYRSNKNQQQKLKILGDALCDKIEDLFDHFGLEYKENGKLYSMCCPIHNGDNPSAFNLYPEGEYYRGNWRCRTHNCEETFQDTILGFVRGMLSTQKYNWCNPGDTLCSFPETIEFCEKFVGQKLNDIKVNNQLYQKTRFNAAMKCIKPTATKTISKITRDMTRKILAIPSSHFIDRGFSEEILDRYDVGLCNNPQKEMYNRVVVPIYDTDYQYLVGCTARSIFPKCDKCQSYHDGECPSKEQIFKYSKWKHSNGFKTQDCLYNYWFAKQHIKKTASAIIVESPGNVWKLEENGIHNSVAIFGTNLSGGQKLLLDSSGAMNLFLVMDNDEAGKKAADNIYKACCRTYNVYKIDITTNDVAEMTSEQIEEQLKKIMEKVS